MEKIDIADHLKYAHDIPAVANEIPMERPPP